MIRTLVIFGFLLSLLGSCGINSNLMFKSPKGEEVKLDSTLLFSRPEKKIVPGDKISFIMEPNHGIMLVQSVSNATTNTSMSQEYTVGSNGSVILPMIGELYVKDMTIYQFEKTLTEKFSKDFNSPFVKARVTNQRVIVFPGSGGDARVVPLTNEYTSLMEVLANVGGISDRGKASTIKLMRIIDSTRAVYHIDLSKIENIRLADIPVHPNDYIYVEPTEDLARESFERVVPVLGILSNIILIFSFLNSL